jgi:DNA-binding CsgD family transcriptional regulator
MTSSEPLDQFLSEVSKCKTRSALCSAGLDAMRRLFGVHVGAIVFVDEQLAPGEAALHGTSETLLEEYNRHWRGDDPVLGAVVERRRPVHDAQLQPAERWRRLPIISDYGRRIDIEPYMSGPLYGHGALAGLVNFCRKRGEASFTAAELERAAVFCGFLSASLATLPQHREAEPLPLTARERQIAVLAAHGKTNPLIAAELGIARETVKQALARVYSKLDVSGRAAMAAHLVKRGWI